MCGCVHAVAWVRACGGACVRACVRDVFAKRRDDEQRGSPYNAKFNLAEIGAVNMGDIGAVRKRSH